MKLPTIQLDWRAYFKAFCEMHGGNPVLHNGRLLFSDGWMYSVDSLSGVEYGAPLDETELTKLQIEYWQARKKIVASEYEQLAVLKDMLLKTQADRSAPLQHTFRLTDDDTGKTVTRSGPLDIGMFDSRIQWLTDDIHECDCMADALTHRLTVIASKMPQHIIEGVEVHDDGEE